MSNTIKRGRLFGQPLHLLPVLLIHVVLQLLLSAEYRLLNILLWPHPSVFGPQLRFTNRLRLLGKLAEQGSRIAGIDHL
ncbi:MAG: hypothetical protein RBS82_13005, partial [Syntrophales bacterium]|nr:hypothetical protein [Syntrophales bacterium]